MRKKSNKVPKASLFPLINKEKKIKFSSFFKKAYQKFLIPSKKRKIFFEWRITPKYPK